MQTFILTLILMFLSVLGLGIGVLAGRPPIKGSCGGLACIGGTRCNACSRKADRGKV